MKPYDLIRRGRISLVIIFLLWFSALASHAYTNYCVVANNTGAIWPYTNWAMAASNIQQAIDLTLDGDTVLVSNGVYNVGGTTNAYSGNVLTNRVVINKAITVMSFNNDPTNTIIKGSGSSDGQTNGVDAVRCVYMSANSTLIGFMLTNGATTANGGYYDKQGGALMCYSGPNLISNCLITGNSAGGGDYGAIVAALGAMNTSLFNSRVIYNVCPTYVYVMRFCIISNCTVAGNNGSSALGSSYAYNSSIVSNVSGGGDSAGGGLNVNSIAWNCIIGWNFASYSGAAHNGCQLNNCLIIGNRGYYNGATGGDCILNNCTVVGNYSIWYGANNAVYAAGVGCMGVPNNSVCVNCIMWGNGNAGQDWAGSGITLINCCTTTNTTGGAVGTGFITNNPMFVDQGSGSGSTYAPGNLRLQNVSPCVNTGTNAPGVGDLPDLDGHMRIRYGTVDMGCYERINSGTIFIGR